MLNVLNLSKSYGSTQAVKELSFDVNKGEIFGLLGPNGAGKSTTLECILGTKKPDSGRTILLGNPADSLHPSIFENIGVQFQDSHYPDLIRVGELYAMTASLYRKATQNRDELLGLFGLEGKIKQPVSKLSGGERQKLAVALALINNPEIVFLDELTAGLDPRARREVWQYLEKLRDKGLTIILTSHFMDEVTRLCDRILIMQNGVASITGSPDEVIKQSGQKTMEDAYLYYTGEKGKYNENIICTV
ncbi:MAG: ABC transporter ATP-binding protein [Spirochaetales bacterium]|nr:ABC transporter ATP-binding protein [Spirochaetales bacterium]